MKAEAKLYLQADEESGGDMAKAFEKHMKSSRSNKSKKAMLNEIEHHLPICRYKWTDTKWHSTRQAELLI